MPALKLRPERALYIVLEDLDFSFTLEEIAQFQDAWARGLSVRDIAKQLKRDPDEIGLLVMDQARKGTIQKRPGGAWGNEW